MTAADKRLNDMNRLADMAHFPGAVNTGATLNILLTISVTWLLVPRYQQPYAPILWIALVLFLNLLPVALLRLTLTRATFYPTVRTINFFRDQHKFSDWVYVAASANMASGYLDHGYFRSPVPHLDSRLCTWHRSTCYLLARSPARPFASAKWQYAFATISEIPLCPTTPSNYRK